MKWARMEGGRAVMMRRGYSKAVMGNKKRNGCINLQRQTARATARKKDSRRKKKKKQQ